MSEILTDAEAQARLEDMCDVDGVGKTAKARAVYASHAALRAENERLRRLLSEVAEGGVEFADERVRYVAVQIDRETWAEVLALAKGDDRGRPA